MQAGRNLLDQAGRVLGRRQVQFGTNAMVMTIAFIAILVLINILVARSNVRWDLTATQEFSLAPETIAIIEQLKQPVKVIGFFDQSTQQEARGELERRLEEYTSRSNLISYEFIDPDVDPITARQYDAAAGTVVFVSEGRHQPTMGTDEQALTRTLVRVTQATPPTVYFLTGHDERSVEDQSSAIGYGLLGRILEEDGFVIEPLNLVISGTIPLENSALVIADPQTELQEQEQTAIATYLASGGRLMLLGNPPIDPNVPPLLPEVLAAAGLEWNNDLLVDQLSVSQEPLIAAVIDYPFSPITSGLTEPSIFPTVRTITQTATITGTTATPLLRSSENIQIVTDFTGALQDNLIDVPGPRTFGYTVEGPIQVAGTATDASAPISARMVVIGDADFASNNFILATSATRDLARNAVGWLMTQEEEVTLPPRIDPVDRSLLLTGPQGSLVFLGTTVLLPLLVIVAGVVVWWRRR